MTTTQDTIDVLRAARQHLVEHGWCQEQAGDDVGPLCIVQAVAAVELATNAYGTWPEVRQELVMTAGGCPSLVDWNDAPDRTFEDVLALFDETIKRLEGEL